MMTSSGNKGEQALPEGLLPYVSQKALEQKRDSGGVDVRVKNPPPCQNYRWKLDF